ncbi:MAG: hypothetical protein Kow0069_23130 [Promethearchaeota archaeon]
MPEAGETNEKEMLTRQLKEELMEAFIKKDFGLKKRENTIMTRVSHDDLKVLQALVELEIFKSISEAVAFLVHDSIVKKMEHYKRILKISEEIKRKKLEAVRTLLAETYNGALDEDEESDEDDG